MLSLFSRREQGHSPLVTGVLLLPIGAAIIVANLCADRIAARLAPPRALALFGVIFGAGCAGMLVMSTGSSYALLAAPLVAYGFGCGALAPVGAGLAAGIVALRPLMRER